MVRYGPSRPARAMEPAPVPPPPPLPRCCGWCGAGENRRACDIPSRRPRGPAPLPPWESRPGQPLPDAPRTALETGNVETYKITLNKHKAATRPNQTPARQPGQRRRVQVGALPGPPRGLAGEANMHRGGGEVCCREPGVCSDQDTASSAPRRPRFTALQEAECRAGRVLERPLVAAASAKRTKKPPL